MLVELGVAGQRYRAVLKVLDEAAAVPDVARRYGWPGRQCSPRIALGPRFSAGGETVTEPPRSRGQSTSRRHHRRSLPQLRAFHRWFPRKPHRHRGGMA